MPKNKLKTKKKGVTMIELLISIFIFLLVISAVTFFIVQNLKNYGFTYRQTLSIEEGRETIKTMVKEIRETKPSDDGHYAIAEAATSTFTFYSDIDRDIQVEKVRYFRLNNLFEKGVTKPTGTPLSYNPGDEQTIVLSSYLVPTTTPIFTYYNGNYPSDTINNPLSYPVDLTAIKMVRVRMIINVDPSRPPKDYILDTFVQLRNMKDNL
jgi:prepilin-type N-terminal cleavage/methylation domain-containing protein